MATFTFMFLLNGRLVWRDESKKGSKDQATIQSSTTPDRGYHMGK